jgi:putative transposase
MPCGVAWRSGDIQYRSGQPVYSRGIHRYIEKARLSDQHGRPRLALDNEFGERFWRSLKYENVYIRGYETVAELYRGLVRYFHWYNEERPHQALENRTPGEVYRESRSKKPGAASVPLFPPLRRVEPILAAGVPSAAEGACRPHKKQGSPTP